MVANGFSSDSPKFGAQFTLSRILTTSSVKLHNHTFTIVLIAPQYFVVFQQKVSHKISLCEQMFK